MGGYNDDRDTGGQGVAFQGFANLDPVHVGHQQVKQDQIGQFLAGTRNGFGPARGLRDLVKGLHQIYFQDDAVCSNIICDQDTSRHFYSHLLTIALFRFSFW